MNRKNGVILFVVEGPSDKEALIPYIEQELLSSRIRVTVKEMHGDILTSYVDGQRIYQVIPGNVKGEIKKSILDYLKKSSVKAEQIKTKDIIKIYYITDTDYCFYTEGQPYENKSECLRRMFKFKELELVKDKPIPFEVIYFSKHLEHVIANDIEILSSSEKEKISIEFGIRSLTEKNFYEDFFRDSSIESWDTYQESYKNIQKYKGRACNMNNFLDELKEMIKKER